MFSSTASNRLDNAWLRRSWCHVLGVVIGVTALSTIRVEAQASANGPVAAYSFSETSGATAQDSSQHGNDAALVNAPARAPGRFGGGLQLDGFGDAVLLPI